jgi:phytoene dehydrogenase-like protein
VDTSLAPKGAHVLSAYVQWIPNDVGRESSAGTDAILETVLTTLEQYAPGLRALVVAGELITPADMERGWGLTGGHIFHGELALDQMLMMRPLLGFGGYRSPIDGLFLCGSGTHPGTGLTGGSGANAARVIAEALR